MATTNGGHITQAGSRIRNIALIVLSLWIGLGLGHTALSLVRTGFPPATPPVAGIDAPPYVQEYTALHTLLEQHRPNNALLLLPASTDTGVVVFLRYQLAYNMYPVRVFARRLTRPAEQEVAGADVVIAGAGLPLPAGWRLQGAQDSFHLYVRP